MLGGLASPRRPLSLRAPLFSDRVGFRVVLRRSIVALRGFPVQDLAQSPLRLEGEESTVYSQATKSTSRWTFY